MLSFWTAYFNPRSPHGERQRGIQRICSRNDFNPRSPHGERRYRKYLSQGRSTFQSTLPARGATKVKQVHAGTKHISIHAPRTGSDGQDDDSADWFTPFQSTLPARGATFALAPNEIITQFQSTLPARGATATAPVCNLRLDNFNPRSPHGERPRQGFQLLRALTFQSTLPARGATLNHLTGVLVCNISIHAPRTGSDGGRAPELCRAADFNPRSPHGERHVHTSKSRKGYHHFNPRSPHGERPDDARRIEPQRGLFQSTLPARGATGYIGRN